jgi:hypothetical protein
MNPAPAFRRCSVLLVLTVTSIAGTNARAVQLTPDSPFAPPPNPNGDTGATTANSPLELHGILATPEGYRFNLCDPSGHINVWIGLNAAGQPFVVRTHDVAHRRVTVEYQGRELTLSLAEPKITPMSMQQPMPMMQPQLMGQLPMPPGAANAGPQNVQRRLELIAEEIRRRRALRANMQAQQFPPGAQVPAYPQLQPQQQ